MGINNISIHPTYQDKKPFLLKCLTKYLKGKVAEYAAIAGGAY
jgi:hypothetical protein